MIYTLGFVAPKLQRITKVGLWGRVPMSYVQVIPTKFTILPGSPNRDPLPTGFQYHSHTARDSYESDMEVVWEWESHYWNSLEFPLTTHRKNADSKQIMTNLSQFTAYGLGWFMYAESSFSQASLGGGVPIYPKVSYCVSLKGIKKTCWVISWRRLLPEVANCPA